MTKKTGNDFLEMYKEYNVIAQKMDKSKEELFTAGNTKKIFPVDYNREKTRTEIKNFLQAMFLSIFRPDMNVQIPGQPTA